MSKELIDVLDENGIKTGEVLPRDEVHKNGLWHRSVVIAILNEKKEILIQQRSNNKEKNAGMWDISVAGHISAGQDAISAAVREINEEVGITLNDSDFSNFKCVFSYRSQIEYAKDFIENQFYEFFIFRKDGLDINSIKMQESEVQAIKFVSIEELQEMIKQKKIVDRKPLYDELIKYLNSINK